VARIRHHPLVPGHIPIHGFLYDVKSGRLEEIEAASEAGAPRIGAEPAAARRTPVGVAAPAGG
jgi:hypothetical protein